MARAWASARPFPRPRGCAETTTETRRSSLPRPPKTTRGGDARFASRHGCAMRSVESRSSHKLRMRCELETLLHTVPLHDPCSEMTTAVAHETHGQARRAYAVTSFCGCKKRARACPA